MNRNLTLILSAVLVFVLLGIWIYIMFFADRSAPSPVTETGEFANFDGLEGGELVPGGLDENGQPIAGGAGTDPINLDGEGEYNPAVLRQLTTRNVAGYGELEVASTTYIMYMESGVGHIYGINLETGTEERISATTIPDTRAADFSPLAPLVAVKAGPSVGRNPLLLASVDVEAQTVVTKEVAPEVDQFSFLTDGTLVFSTVANSAVVVQSYDVDTEETATLFSTPFREARLVFGDTLTSPHYFYPKTSSQLLGFVYVYRDGNLERLAPSGFGLTAWGGANSALVTMRDGRGVASLLAPVSGETATALDLVTLPDKCVAKEAVFYCGVPNGSIRLDSTDDWNKGLINYSDSLWSISATGSEELIDINSFSGRPVDVVKGSLGNLTEDWYFQAKADNTLWVYELSRLLAEETATSSAIMEDEL
jgi:hypothetical protein